MTVQPRGSRWALGAIFLALILFVSWIAFNRPATASMSDGTTFEIAYLDVAPTNVVVRGTFLGQVAERWIPAGGWKFGKYQVRRPQRLTFQNQGRSDLLVVAIKLRPGSPREKNLLLPSRDLSLRFQIIGDDGFGYVEGYAEFRTFPDGVFAHVVTPRFPRDSAMLRFRLEERHPEEPTGWREIATLTASNPKPTTPQALSVEPSRRIRLANDLEIELGQLTISTNAPDPKQLWVNSAMLPVRFWVGGRLENKWGLQSGTIHDALGNIDAATFNSFSSNGWVWHPIERPLNPHVPWRFDAHVARFGDFPETNLFTYVLNHGRSLSTNCNGVATTVSFAGQDLLTVDLPERSPAFRLSVISARHLNGNELDREHSAMNQHHFRASFPARGGMIVLDGTNDASAFYSGPHSVEVTFAVHPNYPIQFTIQPILKSGAPAGPLR